METLFDSACRYMSDSELIYEITNNKKLVTEAERQGGEYDLNGLFSSLTPGRKKWLRLPLNCTNGCKAGITGRTPSVAVRI